MSQVEDELIRMKVAPKEETPVEAEGDYKTKKNTLM